MENETPGESIYKIESAIKQKKWTEKTRLQNWINKFSQKGTFILK